MGIKWGYSSIAELIDEGVDDETRLAIKKIIIETDGVIDSHCLRSRKMAGKIILDVHVLVDKYITASEGHYIAESVRSNVYYNINNIKDITVHVDVSDHLDEFIKPKKLGPSRSEIIIKMKEYMTTHHLNVDILSDKKMLLYYMEDSINIILFIKSIDSLVEFQHKLSHIMINEYKLNIQVVAHIEE
jgi:hypothetical protein